MSDNPPKPAMPTIFYLEDFKVGDRFTTGEYRMDAAEIKAFAAQFDPQPFHLDEEAAKHSLFGGLAASGWHTAAVAMRLMVNGGLPIAGGLIGSSADMRWPIPTRPGDVLHVDCEVLEIRPSRSRPDRGMVKIHCDTRNQRGESVQSADMQVLAFRRPS
jgi:acyl dehydratase